MFTVRSAVPIMLVLTTCTWAQVPGTEHGLNPLSTVKRVCVESLAGEEVLLGPAKEIAIAALFASKRFAVTEKCDKADAVLKGAVLEKSENRVRAEGEGMNFGVARGGAHANTKSAHGGFGAAIGGNDENLMSAETKTSASVTLRLVNRDGDVIWAYTQDSNGAKTKGALADAVERTIRQLLKQAEPADARSVERK